MQPLDCQEWRNIQKISPAAVVAVYTTHTAAAAAVNRTVVAVGMVAAVGLSAVESGKVAEVSVDVGRPAVHIAVAVDYIHTIADTGTIGV